MRLKKLLIYPIKSLGGISLPTNKLEQKGLRNDHRWMLIDKKNRFLSIREHQKFLLFSLYLRDSGFKVSYENDSIDIPFHISGETQKATIWDDQVSVIVGQGEWNDWFSSILKTDCRLVYLPESSPRPLANKWSAQEENVSLADGYPLLVVGTSSLDDLNGKLDEPISMHRFRPNLVFEGGEPYEEYRWKEFTIGDVHFHGLKPCIRCVVTTYNESTGVRGQEPLITLSQQKIDGNIVFGQHALAVDYQTIKVGDEIKVISYKDSPFDLR